MVLLYHAKLIRAAHTLLNIVTQSNTSKDRRHFNR